jgi:hypothetical protein
MFSQSAPRDDPCTQLYLRQFLLPVLCSRGSHSQRARARALHLSRSGSLEVCRRDNTRPQPSMPVVTGDSGLVDWVCARAAANQSVSRCDACQFFTLKQLAPATADMRLPAPECSPVRPRMAWFMCLSPAVDAQALKHLEYVKAAIVSARLNAPSLKPYIILVLAVASKYPFRATQPEMLDPSPHAFTRRCADHARRCRNSI